MSENTAQQTKTRTVSTSYLETIRERKNLSVPEFMEELLKFSQESPEPTFKETITAYANANRIKGTGSGTSDDPNKIIIQKIIEDGMTMLKGEVTRVSKTKNAEEGIYTVSILQESGNVVKPTFNMQNLNSVSANISGLEIFGSLDVTGVDISKESPSLTEGVQLDAVQVPEENSKSVQSGNKIHQDLSADEVVQDIMDIDTTGNVLDEDLMSALEQSTTEDLIDSSDDIGNFLD